MKKLLAMLLDFAMMLSLAACGDEPETTTAPSTDVPTTAPVTTTVPVTTAPVVMRENKLVYASAARFGGDFATGLFAGSVRDIMGENAAAAFDEQTLADINAWVSAQTKERIKEMLKELDDDTVMILLNALTFNGQWEKPFKKYDTYDSLFYPAKGEAQEVRMMSGTVRSYLDDGKATGFVKDYKNGYSFVALLPNEGVSVEEYVASLTGEKLLDTIADATEENVYISMPKLEAECSLELQAALAAMGMDKAFSREADFSRIDGTQELYISKVLHKTYLKIDEEGTEAAASTGVAVDGKGVHLGKSVMLNRPFVMVIMDNENNTILFAGIVNRV